MPRSKFATKMYGPTKPKICEDQQLPPGILDPGPGAHNTVHFLLVLDSTGPGQSPVAGSTTLTHVTGTDRYEGTATIGLYTVAITLTAAAAAFAPAFEWTVRRGPSFITLGSVSASAPRSVDPYDTGVLPIGQRTAYGQEMIRAVARD